MLPNNKKLFKNNNDSVHKILITSEPTALLLLHHFQESKLEDDLASTVYLMKQR
jgi:hypothetical protein